MTTLLHRFVAALLACALPLSASAYSYRQFIIDDAVKEGVQQEDQESDEAIQEQLWDTACREELGTPGGDLLGALRANLNRCLNNKRREEEKQQKRSRASVRTTQYLQTRSQTTTSSRFEGTVHYTRRTLRNQIRLKQAFVRTLPQSSAQKQKSFQEVRSRQRLSVQQKEQAIMQEEKNRSYYVRDARISCQGTQAAVRAQCIKDKIEELRAADSE